MEIKGNFINLLLAVFLAFTILISCVSLYHIVVTAVDGEPPAVLSPVYGRIYNLLYYFKLPFNKPSWEEKRYLLEKTPEENLETTKLPVFDLYIKEDLINKLNKYTPRDPAFLRNQPLYYASVEVPAVLKYNGKSYYVDVRYRGNNWWHWRAPKKSIRVKFTKDDLFFGFKNINLIAPHDIIPFSRVIENELASYLGLMAPRTFMAHVRLNGKYYGVMFFMGQFDGNFLSQNSRPEGDVYGEKEPRTSLYSDTKYWEKYCSYDKARPDNKDSLRKLLDVLSIEDAEKFKNRIPRVLDMEKFYKWYIHASILTSPHQEVHNIRLYFDPAGERFEFIPCDVLTRYEDTQPVDFVYNLPNSRILSYPVFGNDMHRVFWDMVKDDRILNKVLSLIDTLDSMTREDIFCDKDRLGWIFKDLEHYNYRYRYGVSDYEKALGYLREFYVKRFDHIRKELNDCRVRAYMQKRGTEYRLNIMNYGKIGYESEFLKLKFSDGREVSAPLKVTLLPGRYVDPGKYMQAVTFLPSEISRVINFEEFGPDISFERIKGITLTGRNAVTGSPVLCQIDPRDSVIDVGIREAIPSVAEDGKAAGLPGAGA